MIRLIFKKILVKLEMYSQIDQVSLARQIFHIRNLLSSCIEGYKLWPKIVHIKQPQLQSNAAVFSTFSLTQRQATWF